MLKCWPGRGKSYSHGARPVHQIITMIKWIRISRLSIKNSFSVGCRKEGGSSARASLLNAQVLGDAVYVYLVPWSEFSIVPSYPHYLHWAQKVGAESPRAIAFLGVRTTSRRTCLGREHKSFM